VLQQEEKALQKKKEMQKKRKKEMLKKSKLPKTGMLKKKLEHPKTVVLKMRKRYCTCAVIRYRKRRHRRCREGSPVSLIVAHEVMGYWLEVWTWTATKQPGTTQSLRVEKVY